MKGIYYPIAQHLQQFCAPDQFVIWRDAFRWKRHVPVYGDDDGSIECPDYVLSNHYDGYDLEYLAEEFGYEISPEFDLRHVAIVRMK